MQQVLTNKQQCQEGTWIRDVTTFMTQPNRPGAPVWSQHEKRWCHPICCADAVGRTLGDMVYSRASGPGWSHFTVHYLLPRRASKMEQAMSGQNHVVH